MDQPSATPMAESPSDSGPSASSPVLKGVVERLLTDLKNGEGDKDKRRQVEEWMRSLAEKYPEFGIDRGLREYYLAEAGRLRGDFDASSDLTERLNLGRSVEVFLDKAADVERRMKEGAGK